MKRNSLITTIMFFVVAVLLIVTIVLGIVTVVKNNKNKVNGDTNVAATPTVTVALEATPTSAGSIVNTPAPTATATMSPTPTVTPAPRAIICLDPGHQLNADQAEEELGPGSDTKVPKMVSNGAKSAFNGEEEYEWNMYTSDLIKDELRRRGYTVVMTRENNETNISNKERALLANENKADILVGIQVDAYGDESVKGVYAQVPSAINPFVSGLSEQSEKLANAIQTAVVNATEAKSRNLQYGDKLAIVNWAKMPVCIMQLGYMSNPEEAEKLANEDYRRKIVNAVCDGIDAYFAGRNQ